MKNSLVLSNFSYKDSLYPCVLVVYKDVEESIGREYS